MNRLQRSRDAHLGTVARLLGQTVALYLQAVLELFRHSSVPDYALLPWWTRWRVDAEALLAFACSRRGARLLLWLIAWQLASHALVWSLDLHGPVAAVPSLLALCWVLPWVALARRREIARLLRQRLTR